MRKIHQQDQAQKEEEHGAEESDVVAVHKEEGFGDEERHDNKCQPEDNLRSPESILKSGATIPSILHTKEQEGENQVEETETEVDAMHSHPAVTFLAVASNFHIIESQMLQFIQCPWREHDPGSNRVDQEDKGVGDSRRHTMLELVQILPR